MMNGDGVQNETRSKTSDGCTIIGVQVNSDLIL